MQESFNNSKQLLLVAIPLTHPNPAARIVIATDAVLQQREPRGSRPLGFLSRKLTPAELKYAAFDRELAAFATIQHFQELLKCRSFQLWTDHKPLVAALESAATPKPPRRQRQMAYISEYTMVVGTPPAQATWSPTCSPAPPSRHLKCHQPHQAYFRYRGSPQQPLRGLLLKRHLPQEICRTPPPAPPRQPPLHH